MPDMKEFAMAVAMTAAALVAIGLIQKNVMKVPGVGEFLPGYN